MQPQLDDVDQVADCRRVLQREQRKVTVSAVEGVEPCHHEHQVEGLQTQVVESVRVPD